MNSGMIVPTALCLTSIALGVAGIMLIRSGIQQESAVSSMEAALSSPTKGLNPDIVAMLRAYEARQHRLMEDCKVDHKEYECESMLNGRR